MNQVKNQQSRRGSLPYIVNIPSRSDLGYHCPAQLELSCIRKRDARLPPMRRSASWADKPRMKKILGLPDVVNAPASKNRG